jgi:hypothetical protein
MDDCLFLTDGQVTQAELSTFTASIPLARLIMTLSDSLYARESELQQQV